ncbi:uncharacterized protein LOC116262710 isoform X1 [Nymphaea colorata]|nr:uncharacterized protein LOC116262710 isoform X1 [Nymphaea colorata]XP_031498053.1 uncharacterized protein LOC116262710 isoform X1 [Nymphaea colorata]XP_031498055.1 uncharacterized protein LOC116262710 isoform X1 [Nymphaea colorata]XP_031498056.1 uncharacterized protein LOC116262710 isoform X1 [Nymphaea colorata]
MTSVAKVRLVYCPKCQHLLPEIAQFPVYQCGNCKAILQAKHAKAKLEVEHQKADLNSSCNGAASSNGDLNPGNAPDSKHSNDKHRPGEVCQNKLESTAKRVSSLPVDELGCNIISELPQSRKHSDGNFDSKGSNCRVSSTALKPNHKSQKVREVASQNKTLHYPLGNGCDDAVASNGRKEHKNKEHYERLSHTSGSNKVNIEDAASDAQIDCRKKETDEVTAKCPIYNGCSSSSPGIDSDDLVPEQRLRLSRRTLFKQQEDEVTDGLTESIEKNSKSSSPDAGAMEAPSCSSGFMNKGKMTNHPPVSKGSRSPSKTAMHVHHTQIKGHEELYPLTLIQENLEDCHSQAAARRNMNSRFLLQEPSCFLGACTMDEVPYNCMEAMHSNLDYIHDDPLVFDRIECLEHERFELLRKVDELRDYISRSPLAPGRTNGRVPTAGLQFYETDSTMEPTWHALQKQFRCTPCFHQSEAKMQDLHQYHKNSILEGDCVETHRQSPGSHPQSKGMPEACRFSQSPILAQPRICGCEFCFSAANIIETGRETGRSQCADNNSICMFSSCAHSLRNYERPSQHSSCISSNQGLCRACTGPFHYHVNSPTHALRRTHVDASVHFQDSNKKVLMEPEHEDMCLESFHQAEEIAMTMKTTACQPIFGGAPFITCYRCSKLLKLPDLLHSKKRINKVKCGNCSLVLNFAGYDKRHITHVRKHCRLPPAEMDEKGENASYEPCTTCDRQEAIGEFADSRPTNGDDFQSGPVSCSEVCGASIPGSHFSSDAEPSSLPTPFPILPDHVLEKMGAMTNSPEWIRKGMKQTSKDFMNKQKYRRYANESNNISEGIEGSFRAAAGAPLHKHFGYLSASDLLRRDRNGSKESEIGIAHSPVFGTNCLDKDLFLHEMKLEPWASPGLPKKVDREKKSSKDSIVPGFIKKGIRDLSLGLEGMKSKVFVNGRPIPDRLVKKAEERAGPIQPGHYWYDYEAGFWGVMGQPCLGIIPPHIEEFNYPVPRNCTGGKTGVIVNGRELHQKDLDALFDKGLPLVANKEYIVNISGQVIDKASGERFNLVDLAPTIVKAGRGFGMRAPNSIQ